MRSTAGDDDKTDRNGSTLRRDLTRIEYLDATSPPDTASERARPFYGYRHTSTTCTCSMTTTPTARSISSAQHQHRHRRDHHHNAHTTTATTLILVPETVRRLRELQADGESALRAALEAWGERTFFAAYAQAQASISS
mgnify:CR=1 FL=1